MSHSPWANNPALTAGLTGVVTPTRGGTGVSNALASTITLGGALTLSGAFTSTFTLTGVTAVTFPTSGTLATTAQLPVAANPSASVGLAAVNGVAATFMRSDGAPALSQAITPTWSGTHTFSNLIVGSVSGNAATATALATARAINGVNFDGTAAITVTAAAGTLSGATLAAGVTASSLTSVGTLAALTVTAPIVGSVTGSSASATGNAATATALQTARAINGTNFDGTAAITVTAAAGTLTGATLNATVTASSLTSVGTLATLAVTGATTGGSFVPNAGTVATNGMYLPATNSIAFSTNSTERIRVLSSGEVGLGVTPVATIKLQVFTASNKNVGILNQGSEATVSGFTDAGSSAPLRIVGNTLFLAGNGSTNHVQVTSAGNLTALVGNVIVDTAGKGLNIKEGSNAKMGLATMVAGTVTVNTTAVTANSRIMLTPQNASGGAGSVSITARVAGTSFTIGSTNVLDTRDVAWIIFEPS